MTAPRDPDRMIRAFLFEGEEQLHDQIYDAVRAEIEHKRQRAVFGPWRMPIMNKLVPIGLGAAAVVVALVVGAQIFGLPDTNGTGGNPSATPSPSTAPSPTPSPTPTPETPPPLTQTFTSTVHGLSVSYPEGWTAQAATEPWTECLYCSAVHDAPYVDVLYHPVYDDGLFLRIASQPIGDSTPEDWVAAQMASDERCTTTAPIIVDGATGLSGGDTCDVAVVTTASRGYHIDLWMSPNDRDRFALEGYDRAWFEEVLATVQLQPEDAVDVAPSASP